MPLARNKFNKARCPDCQSFHFEIQFNADGTEVIEYKCCRCGSLFPAKGLKEVSA